MRETNRTTFVFSLTILNIRHSVLNYSHHIHHFEFHQLFFYTRIPLVNLGNESENNKHIFCGGGEGKGLTSSGLLYFFVKFLVEVHAWFRGTGYMALSLGYRVLSFQGTEFLVSRVRGT